MASEMLSLKVNTFEEWLSWQGEAGVPRKCSPFPSCLSCQNDKFQSQKLCIGYWGIAIVSVSSRKGKEKKTRYAPNKRYLGKTRNDIYPARERLLSGRERLQQPTQEHVSGAGRLSSSELWLREASCKTASCLLSAFPICPNNHPREIRGKQLGW